MAEWRSRVSRLYADVLALDEAERMPFLSQACGEDDGLRREVESLLAHSSDPAAVFDAPLAALAARALGADGRSLIGQLVSGYRITSTLGVGGMGEVYRAYDATLRREVAIKVLPALFVNDSGRVARFEREARVLAALNHPNVGGIYGVEEVGGAPALVLELVEGPTLAERLEQGPLTMEESLAIARQIAQALEAAHDRGIVHRDLKPTNIKVTRDGTVKVLDFGLATAASNDGARPAPHAPMFMVGATREGAVLGTAGYMSPEQACGEAVDQRTDVWAFGCVLYEMLTGRPAFQGGTVSDTIAAVLGAGPEWSALPDATPTNVRRLLNRCLRKDQKRRLHDIADAWLELEEGEREETIAAAVTALEPGRGGRLYNPALFVGMGLLALAIGAASVFLSPRLRPGATALAVMRTAIVLPPDQELDVDLRSAPLTLSPDGTRLVYAVEGDGRKRLYLRKLSDLDATPLPGTVGATQPFFSHDGDWVAFFARGLLQKVSVQGGAPLPICKVSGVTMGGSWGPDNTIVFATLDAGLSKVAARGGTPQPLSGSEGAEWPEILPDGRTVLFAFGSIATAGVGIATMRLDSGARRALATHDASQADPKTMVIANGPVGGVRFVPPGYLIFGQGARGVRAVRFEVDSLTLEGSPVSVVDSAFKSGDGGPVYFAVSSTGDLVYSPEDPRRRLVWVERNGRSTPIGGDQEAFRYPRLSPDGRHIAVDINTEERRSDIWIYDAERGAKTRLTSEQSSILPVWTPDGLRVAFSESGIVLRPHEGTGKEEILIAADSFPRYPTSWSPDGRDLLITSDTPGGFHLSVLTHAAGSKPRELLVRSFNDAWAQFSPDGRWVAYISDESGTNEAYVAHYPDMEAKVIVSTHGANWTPVWARNGREVFYRQGNAVMAVPVETFPALRVGTPRLLFTGPYDGVDGDRTFDLSPDGRRFLMTERVDPSVRRQLVVVQNWMEGLKQRAPRSR